ncbi:GcvT family protein [Candidatus Entotheonella palauensis]|nr:FAD-dependent oxidoreductase [Candidatus Entotheonella palauensis]
MQDHAQVVIIGAGIAGCATAYYLTEMGWRDIVVVEQGPLYETGGSTSHAPGLVFQVNASKTMATFAKQTVELYAALQVDHSPCWHAVGGMEVAWTQERWEDLKRKVGFAKSWGIEACLLSSKEAQDKIPLLTDNIHGAMYVPSDGITKAVLAAEALAQAAQAHGARFYGQTPVTGIEVHNGRIRAVQTPQGRIATEIVLAAAGIWGPRIGQMAGVPIALHPMQHLLARTAPLLELRGAAVEADHPILRHQDRAMYFRQAVDGYMIGSYQHEPILTDPDDIPSHGDAPLMPSVMPWTPSHFDRALQSAIELVPALRGKELVSKINGMFSFTPDAMPIIGESPDVKGFWSAQAVWITHAGGVAKAVAEWLVHGSSSIDLREADISRFHRHAYSRTYLRARAAQQYREVYDIIHPLQQLMHPRNLRLSPCHQRHCELGAHFFEAAGWERPQWYVANEGVLQDYPVPRRSGWEARCWSPIIGAEHQATRDRVGLFDLTPFTKLDVTGPGALAYLQWLTGNDMDRPAGKVTYTSMLNERGGIVCDLTVTRLGEQHFRVITGGTTGPRDLAWLQKHLPADGSVTVTDISASQCCLAVWGPHARDLVQRVSPNNLSNTAFPYLTAQPIVIGEIPVLAVRISYVGELGWELYTATEYGLRLWDLLWEAGQSLGAVAVGAGAFESLRLEKGYRLWGNDIHTEYTPYEAGLAFAVRLRKSDFLGRSALVRRGEAGITQKLCCLVLDTPDHVVMGKEPILDGDQCLGYVTSANYGYTVGKSLAYGYLPLSFAAPGTHVEIEYFGKRYPATVADEPLFDPAMTRLKC